MSQQGRAEPRMRNDKMDWGKVNTYTKVFLKKTENLMLAAFKFLLRSDLAETAEKRVSLLIAAN